MRYTLLSTFAMFLFATYPTIAKPLLHTAHPLLIVTLTGLSSSLVIMLMFGAIPEIKKGFRARKKDGYLILMAFFTGALGPVLHLFGLSQSSIVNSVLLMTLTTPITALLSWIFLREKIGAQYVAGLLFLFFGMTVYSTDFFRTNFHFQANDLFFVGAAASFAAADVVYKKKLSHISPELVLLSRNFIGSLLLLLTIAFLSLEVPLTVSLDQGTVTGIGLLVVFPVLLAQTLWYVSLKKIKLKEAAFIDALYPLFSSFIAFVVLQEGVTPAELAGGFIVISGLLISQMQGHGSVLHHHSSKKKELAFQGRE